MDTMNLKIKDMLKAYNNIKEQGVAIELLGNDWSVAIESHIQGVAIYRGYLIITHSGGQLDSCSADRFDTHKGFICIYNLDTQEKNMLYHFNTPEEGYDHPGGIQIIGDVLVVPLEGESDSIIRFYDLSVMTYATPPSLMDYKLKVAGKVGGVGITSYSRGEFEVYLLATYADNNGNPRIDFYDSITLSDFSLVESYSCPKSGYQEICLLTDTNQVVYMIGFRGDGRGLSYIDYVDLYEIDPIKMNIIQIDQDRHMITDSVSGNWYGVHFRWGAGLKIQHDTRFDLLATERDFYEQFYINTFSG